MEERKNIDGFWHVSYFCEAVSEAQLAQNSTDFYQKMDKRRSVRDFSDRAVPQEVIENLILTASTAPSGAHKQPWTFCAVGSPALKAQIRAAAEQEEYESYTNRMSQEWRNDLVSLGTNWQKPFLETAPWLIVLFGQSTGPNKEKHYYVQESVGIAAGFLIAAIHQAGLVTLTHTPSPMGFLKKILQRSDHERPFLLLPVGYPANDAFVPDIQRKPLNQVSVFYT
jgi:iodotyrosine deiodinase